MVQSNINLWVVRSPFMCVIAGLLCLENYTRLVLLWLLTYLHDIVINGAPVPLFAFLKTISF